MTGMSTRAMEGGMPIGSTIDVMPRIARMLKMFDPTTLPIATSPWRLAAAATEVASSGRLVPIATIESPIAASDRPAARAMAVAEVDEQVRSEVERGEPAGEHERLHPAGEPHLGLGVVRLVVPPVEHGHGGQIGGEHQDHRGAGRRRYAAEHAEGDHSEGSGDHHREVPAEPGDLGRDRGDDRGHAGDQQHVRDVRADDVADGDVGRSVHRRAERDGQLRHRGAEADDGQPDQEWRQVEAIGERHRALDEPSAAEEQEREPGEKSGDVECHA